MENLIPQKKTLHILLADDDEDDRFFFKEAVEREGLGAEVKEVVDGQLLLDLLETGSELPDLLFLDLNMPRKTGHECLHDIRSMEKLKNIPIVIYTTSKAEEDIDSTYSNGADYYVTKPTTTAEFRYALKLLLSKEWGDHETHPREQYVVSAKNLRAAARSLR